MNDKPINYISTHWTEIEIFQQQGELRELSLYLADRYFKPLSLYIKKRRSQIDDQEAREFACEVFFELLQKDYSPLKKLERDNGKFRGLLTKIARAKLSKIGQQKEIQIEDMDSQKFPEAENWFEICMDVQEALERLEKENHRLFLPFKSYYLEGRTISEICRSMRIKEPAVRQRIYRARELFASHLHDYQGDI